MVLASKEVQGVCSLLYNSLLWMTKSCSGLCFSDHRMLEGTFVQVSPCFVLYCSLPGLPVFLWFGECPLVYHRTFPHFEAVHRRQRQIFSVFLSLKLGRQESNGPRMYYQARRFWMFGLGGGGSLPVCFVYEGLCSEKTKNPAASKPLADFFQVHHFVPFRRLVGPKRYLK